ncbi:MAG: biotin transporter BioY [Clostridia bacterium]|nr:biotin transporter BioY [Clostridia bacterium]
MNKSKTLKQTVRAALCAALIAVSSFIIIPLSAVPVTLQTFTVCVTAALLGLKWGVISVSVYILLGAAGLPVFSGFGGGIGVLMGAGGGFIWGFLIMAVIVGFVSDKFGSDIIKMIIAMAVGTVGCYIAGILWYILVYSGGEGIMAVLSVCVFPFILPDAVKIIAAATIVSRLKKRLN